MKKTHLCLLLAGLLVACWGSALLAQDDWYVSAANYGRYYYFRETKADSAATRFQFDVNMGNFYAGGWFEAAQVKNDLGSPDNSSSKLTQRFFGWENSAFTVHAGNFYQVFDRGLILNSFHDDDVSINKVLDGIKLDWRNRYVDLDGFTAKDSASTDNRPLLRGVRTKFKPVSFLHVGGGYVSLVDGYNSNRTNLDEINVRAITDYFDGYVEYARRRYNVLDIFDPTNILEKKQGDGTYVNVTGYYSAFTALVEYKNYYDLLYNYGYDDLGILNIPPAVNRQDRQMSDLAANVHSPIVGERGYRVNLGYAYDDYWGGEVDYSRGYSRTPATVENKEMYGEIRGNFLDNILFKVDVDFFDFSWQDSFFVAWVDSLESASGGFKRNELRPEIEVQIGLDDIHSIGIDAYLINYDYSKPASMPVYPDTGMYAGYRHEFADSSDYSEKYLDITFFQAPNFRFTIGGSLSNREFSPDRRKMAYAELGISFGNHELTIFQGDQRGGLVCSGGVCTYHPTFQGTRVTLISRL
jgi:hypothetical protein